MLRMAARLNSRVRAMPRRSPFTSVMSALSIATSVPPPIAMPICAAASAGASLTATAFTRACAKRGSGPTIIQTTNVTIATAITMQIGSSSRGSGSGKKPSVYPRLSSSLLEAERGGRRTGRTGILYKLIGWTLRSRA